jgi:putative ABC transport system permease protein
LRTVFARLSYAYFRRHKLTTALTVMGVALGVAVFVAIDLAGLSLTASLRETIDRIAGKAQLEVAFGESGVPEDELERVQKMPEVAVASPVIQAVVRPDPIPGREAPGSLLIVATDLLGDRTLREYDIEGNEDAIDDPLVFLAQPDSIALSKEYAARQGLKLGDPMTLTTAAGRKKFTVRGLMNSTGVAKAYGGNIAMMDIYAAQLMFGRGRRFDRLDVMLTPGVTLAQGTAALRSALGPGYGVDTPAGRSAQLESLLTNFNGSMQMSSVQALLIGIFLIYNIFSVAVIRRRGEIGTLRALGATRGEITRLFLAEAAVVGLLGSALGLWAGRWLAQAAFNFMRGLVAEGYGVDQIGESLTHHPAIYLAGLTLGCGSALLAAWWPARRAARVDPVEALAGGVFEKQAARFHPLSFFGGLLLLAAGLSVMLFPPLKLPAGLHFAALALLNFAAILLAPAATGLLIRLLRPVYVRLLGAEGRLACDAVATAPRRTGVTVAALLVAVAFVVNSGGFATAWQVSFSQWMDDTLNADLYVTNSEKFMSRSSQFPESVGAQLAKLPGVRSVEPIRNFRLVVPSRIGTPSRNCLVLTADFSKGLKRIKLEITSGSEAEARDALIGGRGVVISDNLALTLGYRRGDTLPVVTPRGAFDAPIVAVIREYSSDQGTIFMPRAMAVRYWEDSSVDTWDLMLEDPARRQEVKSAVLAALGSERTVFVYTGAEFRGAIQKVLDKFFALSDVQVLIAVLVAVMGIANALLIGVFERRREIGLLKALGADRWQVARLIGLEAAAITLIGLAEGLAFGAILNFFSIRIIGVLFGGWLLPYHYPWLLAAQLSPLLLAVGLAAAVYPARVASKLEPALALAYE